jgi:hypothetical protein
MSTKNKTTTKYFKTIKKAGFDLYIATGGYTLQKIGKLE